MKKIFFLLLLISTFGFAQTNPTSFVKVKVTGATKKNDATRMVVQDSITKEYHWILKSSLGGSGTVTSVTGTDGITVANGTTTPVIGISSIVQSKVTNLVSDLAAKENISNKQNSLTVDGSGIKYPTIDLINTLVTGTNPFENIRVKENAYGLDTYSIGQTMGFNDYWKIYGSAVSLDKSEMIFELGDNGSPYDTVGERFRFSYNASNSGISKSPLIIDYNEIIADANLTATTFKKSGGTSYQFLKADGSIDATTYATPLGFTPENVTNKDNGTLTTSTTTYPTSGAVKTVTDAKQATLVSGTNIKTINGATLLGSGDLSVSGVSNNFTLKYFKNYFTDLTGFTATSLTPTYVDGKMRLTGGVGNFSQYLTFDGLKNTDENIEVEVIFKATVIGAGGYGVAIGKRSINTWYNASVAAHFSPTQSTAYLWDSNAVTQIANKTTSTVVAGDIIRLKYTQLANNIVLTFYNLTQSTSGQISILGNLGTTKNFKIPNTSDLCLWNLGGTMDIISLKVTSFSTPSPNVLCIGDSKTVGYSATNNNLRWASNIQSLGTVITNAGDGDRTVETTQTIDYTKLIKAKYAIVAIGRNDLASGVSSGTWQANYQNIVTQLQGQGTTVFHLLPVPETSLSDQSALKNWIIATYGSGVCIDPSVGWSNGTMLSSDGVHPNEVGHAYIAKKILDSGLITAASPLAVLPKNNEIDLNGNIARLEDIAVVPLNEGGGIGYVINNRIAANYGNVGLASVDLSFSDTASSTFGATGGYSFATGYRPSASGSFSAVDGGSINTAAGNFSFVGGGYNNLASGNQSGVLSGDSNSATLTYSNVSGGTVNTASGLASSVVGGERILSKSYAEIAGGSYNTSYTPTSTTAWSATDRVFGIGNGTSSGRSDAIVLLKNGLATLPSVTNTLISAETTGKAIVTKSWVPEQVKDFMTDVNNVSTTETDLMTYTTAANRLNATGEKLVFNFTGTFNDATASSDLKWYYGGQAVGDTGALTMSVTGAFVGTLTVIRTGSTTARVSLNISTPGASTAGYTKYTSLTGVTFTGTNIIKLTGTAGGDTGGDNDITGTSGNIIWQPAAL